MKQLLEHKYLVRKNILTLVGMFLCFYFSYHLLQGERSYVRFMALQKNINDLKAEDQSLQLSRQTLETRVAMLRSGSIDRDLLEERARIVLGYRNSGEKDILVRP